MQSTEFQLLETGEKDFLHEQYAKSTTHSDVINDQLRLENLQIWCKIQVI
jgi:hypothetical protein